jgi:hypothetical protein
MAKNNFFFNIFKTLRKSSSQLLFIHFFSRETVYIETLCLAWCFWVKIEEKISLEKVKFEYLIIKIRLTSDFLHLATFSIPKFFWACFFHLLKN